MKTLLAFLLTLTLSLHSTLAAKKNIVFFIVDDMSTDTGAYGNPAIKTPNLDALAADATRFTHAFATTASCSASRSVVLTGLHNHANGHYGHQHDFHGFESWLNVRALPTLLEEVGYRTAQIGKLHVAPHAVFKFGTYLKANSRSTIEMAETSRVIIESDDDKPFFLYFATSDPHRGGGKDKNSELDLAPDMFGNKQNRQAYPGVKEVFYDPADVAVPPFLPDTPETRAELAQYYQSISRIDQGVGRLIEILKDAGKWDDTLFVFTADHGMAFPGAKTNVYEPALRVPFIVRDPAVKKRGITSDAMLSFVDITPSLLDYGGGYNAKNNAPIKPDSRTLPPTTPGENRGKPYRGFHGRSFIPIIGQQHADGWDQIAASHTFHEIQMYYPMRVVRDRKYKLIWNIAHAQPYPFASDLWAASTWQAQWKKGPDAPYGQKKVAGYTQRAEFELFDIENDPNESTNLADNSKFAGVLTAYQEKLKTAQKQTGDPWIMKWRYE